MFKICLDSLLPSCSARYAIRLKRARHTIGVLLLLILLVFFSCSISTAELGSRSRSEIHSADLSERPQPLASTERREESPLFVGIGESITLPIANRAHIHISDGSRLRARAMGDELILTGRKMGRVTLRFRGPRGQSQHVYVVSRKTARLASSLSERMVSMRGLRLSGDALPQIEVHGELLRASDYFELVQLGLQSGEGWVFSAEVDQELQPLVVKGLKRKLNELQLSEARVSFEMRRLLLSLAPSEADSASNLLPILKSMGLTVQVSKAIGGIVPMVKTKVVIAEVRKSSRRVLGIRWPNLAEASLIPSVEFPLGGLTAALEALESKGEAQILAMPTLLCQSGSKAEFLAGGELPIRLANLRLQSIQWKRYGVQLNIAPKADFKRNLQMKLSTEISTLEGASAAEGIPGLLTNRVETEFNLRGDQTIVLSGLLKKEQHRAADGLPGLMSLPVLGALFRSEDFRKNLSELLIFLTPEVINPNDTQSSAAAVILPYSESPSL